MTDQPHRCGISGFTTQPWSFDADVARHARLGVDTIEVVEAMLGSARLAEQMASIAAGLSISGVQSKVGAFFASRITSHPTALDNRVVARRNSIGRLGQYAFGVRSSSTPAPTGDLPFAEPSRAKWPPANDEPSRFAASRAGDDE